MTDARAWRVDPGRIAIGIPILLMIAAYVTARFLAHGKRVQRDWA